MLNPEQIRQRDGKLTASRVACLMTGDEEKILNLWREMVGDPDFAPEDLSDVWAVQLGSHTESLNLDWYEKRTGFFLAKRGAVVVRDGYDWAAATLDGWDEQVGAPVECKHVGGFEKTSTVLERYAPQAHWQMLVTSARKCIFSIIEGAREPIIEVMDFDADYAHELWKRAAQFMECVWSLTPPVSLPAVAAPIKPEKVYDFTGNNEWGANAAAWVMNKQSAKDFEAASKTIKSMIPADAIKASGHGISVSRSKSGALTIREKE